MRIGKQILIILYVMAHLLSDTHLTGVPVKKEAVIGLLDIFMYSYKEEHDLADDEAFLHVAYALNGGINHEENKTQIAKDDLPVTLEIPTREGYNFAGWYTDSNFQNKVTTLERLPVSEIVLFAKWTEEIDNYQNVEKYAYELNKKQTAENQKLLTECDYSFSENISIPGMPQTRESDYKNNYIAEAAQCMQGLCFTPDYILMTAYSETGTAPGALMIFDRKSGKYLITLAMRADSHLGGVAYDGENIWICHSERNTLEQISYAFVRQIVESGAQYSVDVSGISKEYAIKNTPSSITCYGGRIWVATHSIFFTGEMVSYSFDEEMERLTALREYQIPKRVQGVAFDEDGAVYFSTSYGRQNSSYLKAYTSLLTLKQNPETPEMEVEMPPCSEEVAFVDDSLFILFESASEKYFEGTDGRGISLAPLDTLLKIEIASFW